MQTKYFVKFIGDKNVTLAKAHDSHEEEVLVDNNYEETTQQFYNWLRSQTSLITAK